MWDSTNVNTSQYDVISYSHRNVVKVNYATPGGVQSAFVRIEQFKPTTDQIREWWLGVFPNSWMRYQHGEVYLAGTCFHEVFGYSSQAGLITIRHPFLATGCTTIGFYQQDGQAPDPSAISVVRDYGMRMIDSLRVNPTDPTVRRPDAARGFRNSMRQAMWQMGARCPEYLRRSTNVIESEDDGRE